MQSHRLSCRHLCCLIFVASEGDHDFPFFADDEPYLEGATHHGATTDPASSLSSCGTRACCDGHRLFGEALVLYLKSLSMAKQAILWGNQAMEPLSHLKHGSQQQQSPSASSSQRQPSAASSSMMQPPATPPLLPVAPMPSPRLAGSSAGVTRTATPRGQQQNWSTGTATSLSLSPPTSGGTEEIPHVSPGGETRAAAENQVAAWGSSIVAWLTGQFSAVLRRAELCRTELRGPETGEDRERGRGQDHADVVPPERSSVVTGTGAEDPTSQSADSGVERISQACGRPSMGRHGAAPTTIAVSARDVVVRAALTQAQESAASEMLGMWQAAREGYEKVRECL